MSDLISRFVEEGMMWEAPIKVMQKQVKMQMEGEILKAVQEVGIVVDKEELMKALKHDREQYEKGYVDGFNANKWIPCSERLPEEGEEVLIATKTSDKIYFGMYTKRYGFSMREGFICGEDFMWLNTAIAWMPLPEAYKGE